MSVKWVSVFAVLLSAISIGCGGAEGPGESVVTSAAASAISAKLQTTDDVPAAEIKTSRRVIREGELRFETADKTATRKSILGFVKIHQGYLADDREQRNQNVLEQTITIRVPSVEFDGLLDDVSSGVTRFDKREVRAIDVTDEFVDVEARLKTKKETESRYRELLKQANSVEEILKIEEQIGKLREDIESTEGRLRLLKDRESYSTLTVSFYESIFRTDGFWSRIKANFFLGWQIVVTFTIAIVVLWPLILLACLGLLVVYWFNRKSGSKKAKQGM